jgi:hypothetical protein
MPITDEPWEDERLQTILRRLTEQTRAGNIAWENVSSRGVTSFAYSTPSSTAVIGSQDIDGNYPFLEILDSSGVAVERLVQPQLSTLNQMLEKDPVRGRKMQQIKADLRYLYIVARRVALNADEAIDNLLAELGEDS